MPRKDYTWLANILKSAPFSEDDWNCQAIYDSMLFEHVADSLARLDSHFDRSQFLADCGLEVR